MTEYISRDAAIETIRKAVVYESIADLVERAINSIPAADVAERASGIIGVIPAADVRPVVTCGECKHWVENGTDYCSCDRDALLRERDFFCAAGEKRGKS